MVRILGSWQWSMFYADIDECELDLCDGGTCFNTVGGFNCSLVGMWQWKLCVNYKRLLVFTCYLWLYFPTEAENNSPALIGSLVSVILIVTLISVVAITLILFLIRRKRRLEAEKDDDVFRSVLISGILQWNPKMWTPWNAKTSTLGHFVKSQCHTIMQ